MCFVAGCPEWWKYTGTDQQAIPELLVTDPRNPFESADPVGGVFA